MRLGVPRSRLRLWRAALHRFRPLWGAALENAQSTDRMNSPVLVLACSFALGILLAQHTNASPFVLLFAGACCLLAAGLAVRGKRLGAAGAIVLAGFVFAGASSARLFQYRFSTQNISHIGAWGVNLKRALLLQGVLATSPLQTPYGLQFDLKVTRISDGHRVLTATGRVRLRVLTGKSSVPPAALQLQYGDSIRAWSRLRRPRGDLNPGGFDYRRWMQSIQDIYWQGVIERPQDIQKVPGPRPPILNRAIASIRVRLIASIDQLYPPWSVEGRDGAVLKAILLGDRSSLDSQTIENFRKSGIYHLLVVAGLHVGLLALLVEGLLRLLRLRDTWRALLLLIFLVVYASLVEQRAPTLRASLMIGSYLVARLLDRDHPPMNAIGIAALVLLFERPAWLMDSGFQLSFAAALLIAGLAAPVLSRWTGPYHRALWRLQDRGFDPALEPRMIQFRLDLRDFAGLLDRKFGRSSRDRDFLVRAVGTLSRGLIWMLDLVIFSAILQWGLLLPMVEIFHRVTLAGIGLNALAVPLMTLLLAVAVPVVTLNLAAPALAAFPGKVLALIMQGLFGLTQFPHMPHWLSFRVPTPPLWVACGFGLAVILAGYGLVSSLRAFAAAGAAAFIFGLLIALSPFPPALPAGRFEVTELDCGGGEGLFMALPGAKSILVGAGGGSRMWLGGGDPIRARRWDPGENIVSPYLWSRGIKTLDVLFLPDTAGDHLSGVASILRNFRVKQFWYGSLPSRPGTASLRSLLQRHGVAVRKLRSGDVVTLGSSRFEVIWRASAGHRDRKQRTGLPVLLRVSNPDGSVLLAADLNRTDQQRALKSNLPWASSVLEASPDELDSPFASRVEPAVVLEDSETRQTNHRPAAGGAPKPQTMRVFDVSQSGAVTVSLRGGAISIHSYVQPRGRESR